MLTFRSDEMMSWSLDGLKWAHFVFYEFLYISNLIMDQKIVPA